jgi:hypothetical protein
MITLTPKQIAKAQRIIDRTVPGEYELTQLYGSQWTSISKPTSFGKSFKATVKAGLLRNIRNQSLKTNNHHTYVVGNS